jgi:WD40 repeat protein
MVARLGLGFVGILLWQVLGGPDADKSRSSPGPKAVETTPAESQPIAAPIVPKRFLHFSTGAIGNSVTIACSADGKWIAIANGNPTRIMQARGASTVKDNWRPSAEILNAETGTTIVALQLMTPDEDDVLAGTKHISHIEATALTFAPDGSLLAVGTSIGQVKLFDAQTGKLIRSLDDEAAKLAENETPENWKSIRRAMGSIASLAFSPDGSLLATCGASFSDVSDQLDGVRRLGLRGTGPGRLKVWDVPSGTLKYDLVGHNNHANAVAFSPDGQLLASAGRWMSKNDFSGNGVILWNPHTGTQIHSLIRTTANGGTRAIAFSPDSRMLALGTQRFDEGSSTGGVSLVRVSTGTEEWLVTVPGWARPLDFSPDGQSVVVLCGGRSIRFLDTESGTLKHEIRQADSRQGERWNDFAVSKQGRTLTIGGVDSEQKGNIELWDIDGPDTATIKVEPGQQSLNVRARIPGQDQWVELATFMMDPTMRPYLHPVRDASGSVVLTEDRPADHVWQHGIFTGFHAVNGFNYWKEDQGKQRFVRLLDLQEKVDSVSWRALVELVAPDGTVVLEEEDAITIHTPESADAYTIDFELLLRAKERDVNFGKFFVGGLAVRMPWDQANPRHTHLNSNGLRDSDCEQQRAAWCNVERPFGDDVFGVAVFDSPANSPHPPGWRVDEQGLINPNVSALGDWTIRAKQERQFQYRLVIYRGSATREQLEARFAAFAEPHTDQHGQH